MTSWPAKLGSLFRDHSRHLVALATRRVGDREVAAELVQDIYTRLLQAGHTGDREGDTKVLYTSLRHALIDHRRRSIGRGAALEQILPVQLGLGEVTSPEGQVLAREALSALDEALLELSPKAREMFLLHRVDGVSNAQLADRFGISVSAVEKQLARVMRHCQDRLAGHMDHR